MTHYQRATRVTPRRIHDISGQALVLTIMILSIMTLITFIFTALIAKNIHSSSVHHKRTSLYQSAKQHVIQTYQKIIQSEPLAADWRENIQNTNTNDPDYRYLSLDGPDGKGYFTREIDSINNTRILTRIRIIKSLNDTSAFIPNCSNIIHKTVIECVAKQGVYLENDPTTHHQNLSYQEAKCIGIIDSPLMRNSYNQTSYLRLFHNLDHIKNKLALQVSTPDSFEILSNRLLLQRVNTDLEKIITQAGFSYDTNINLPHLFSNMSSSFWNLWKSKPQDVNNNPLAFFFTSPYQTEDIHAVPQKWMRKNTHWFGPYFQPQVASIEFQNEGFVWKNQNIEPVFTKYTDIKNCPICIDGDCSVSGMVPPNQNLTLVCNGTIYISGPIYHQQNRPNIFFVSKNHIVVNPTQFIAPEHLETKNIDYNEAFVFKKCLLPLKSYQAFLDNDNTQIEIHLKYADTPSYLSTREDDPKYNHRKEDQSASDTDQINGDLEETNPSSSYALFFNLAYTSKIDEGKQFIPLTVNLSEQPSINNLKIINIKLKDIIDKLMLKGYTRDQLPEHIYLEIYSNQNLHLIKSTWMNVAVPIQASLYSERGSFYVIPPNLHQDKTEDFINYDIHIQSLFISENIPAPLSYQNSWNQIFKNRIQIQKISFKPEDYRKDELGNYLYPLPFTPLNQHFMYLGPPIR